MAITTKLDEDALHLLRKYKVDMRVKTMSEVIRTLVKHYDKEATLTSGFKRQLKAADKVTGR